MSVHDIGSALTWLMMQVAAIIKEKLRTQKSRNSLKISLNHQKSEKLNVNAKNRTQHQVEQRSFSTALKSNTTIYTRTFSTTTHLST
jgi:hypothetical protein